jgi:hypothetical protein
MSRPNRAFRTSKALRTGPESGGSGQKVLERVGRNGFEEGVQKHQGDHGLGHHGDRRDGTDVGPFPDGFFRTTRL